MEESTGKRGWNSNFHGGLGKRRWNSNFSGGLGKRAWNSNFSGGLGKRAWNKNFSGINHNDTSKAADKECSDIFIFLFTFKLSF